MLFDLILEVKSLYTILNLTSGCVWAISYVRELFTLKITRLIFVCRMLDALYILLHLVTRHHIPVCFWKLSPSLSLYSFHYLQINSE